MLSIIVPKTGKTLCNHQSFGEAKKGLTRKEVASETGIADGMLLTRALNELEECGFIRKYRGYQKEKRDSIFQITDPFTLFCMTFSEKKKYSSWLKYIGTPGYYAWCGLAFEMVCLNHIPQIKSALGISGIESREYSWRSISSEPGAQIDLVIDRSDNVVNVCEMKYSDSPYRIDNQYAGNLLNKIEAFRNETKTRKTLHLTLVCPGGLSKAGSSGGVVNVITAEDLFERS